MTLRLIGYVGASLPPVLFERLGTHLEKNLGTPVRVACEPASAPPPHEPDPFTRGDADVGFVRSWTPPLSATVKPLRAVPILDTVRYGDDASCEVIARATLPSSVRNHVAQALLALHADDEAREELAALGLIRFEPTN